MLLFCPSCSNILTIRPLRSHEVTSSDAANVGDNMFVCRTCPYQLVLNQRYYERHTMEKKAADDILGGEDAWANVDKMDAKCPRCDNPKAYYRQVQIRSADEPATLFLKCTKCSNEWREN